jgi:uncharacterized membrane protein
MKRLWTWFRRHRDEERGAVLVLTAISMFAVLGAGAMGVDLGFTVYGSRQAQAMADTAAADVIQYITTADQQGSAQGVQKYLNTSLAGVLADNNSDAQLTVTPLLYQKGTYTFPADGCATTNPPNPLDPICNAVAVGAKQTVPQPFWGGFNTLAGHSGSGLPPGTGCGNGTSGGCGMGCANLTPCFSCPTNGCTTCPTTSCYQLQPQACFSIGTYLANYDSQQTAVINDILEQLGGSSVNLTAVGYQGLANTYVTLNQLISASGTVLSPSTVMTSSLNGEGLATLLSDAVQNQQQSGMCSTGTSEQTNAEQALSALAGDLTNGPASLKLCSLISIDGSTCASYQTTPPTPPTYAQLSTGINVLQALTTAAELSNGTSGITVNLSGALGLTGFTQTSLALQVVQPAQIAYGPLGSVTTPASGCPPSSGTATCATTAQVSGTLTVSVGGYAGIAIPFTAATGTATFNFATCAWTGHQATTLEAMTTTAALGVTLGGSSLVTLNFAGANPTLFSYPAAFVPPTSSTDSGANPSNPKQLGSSDPTPTISGASGQWTLVGPLLAPLDAILGQVLQAAGVTVGGANVADLGLDCDAIAPGV